MKRLEIHTLDKGYCDRDYILLHACFQILVDYVEKEKEVFSWLTDKDLDGCSCKEEREAIERQMSDEDETRYLYKWWKVERFGRIDPLDAEDLVRPDIRELDSKDSKYDRWKEVLKESHKLVMEWHEEDQENLHRLVDIRCSLWT